MIRASRLITEGHQIAKSSARWRARLRSKKSASAAPWPHFSAPLAGHFLHNCDGSQFFFGAGALGGLGWAELSTACPDSINLSHLSQLTSLRPPVLQPLSFGAFLLAIAAQQRLRRCISLGGACGAIIFSLAAPTASPFFHQQRLRHHF